MSNPLQPVSGVIGCGGGFTHPFESARLVAVRGVEQDGQRKMLPREGRVRVVVEDVRPEVDCGAFPAKRIAGETIAVQADIFTDGHDLVAAELLYRYGPAEDPPGAEMWSRSPMKPLGNDRWQGEFLAAGVGPYYFTIEAWIDRFATWRAAMLKRAAAENDLCVETLIGAGLLDDTSARATPEDAARLRDWARVLRSGDGPAKQEVLADDIAALARRYPDRRFASRYGKVLRIVVDREKARFSAWYEMFPRSSFLPSGAGPAASSGAAQGTLLDCQARLPYIAGMGFDVLYLPPIHPIGHTGRKGKNNSSAAEPGDAGSPWAIGSEAGGHTSIDSKLGTLDDFKALIARAKTYGIEIALDLAFQCSPDHPYVARHPEWFRARPDGTIQYAENPPKKYEDIFPLDFETAEWRELWQELQRVVLFWVEHGVRIFRVDNPHTKALPFWQWLIEQVKLQHPEVLFLAEAFTRPKLMYRLAKLGFSQSYTYFTWRNAKAELTAYFQNLAESGVREYFRPNLWPNTPDILPEFLQTGGRAAFMIRFILAATLGANYGVYGPAFELCEGAAKEAGSEEYLNSEKYEIKHWDVDSPRSLRDLIARVNRIRRENPALQSDSGLHFHSTDNPQVICYSKANYRKSGRDQTDIVIIVCNLDPFHSQSGWIDLDLASLGIDSLHAFQAHDLLSDARFVWRGPRNYFELTPESLPAHVMKVRRLVRTERDFDYYF